MIDSGVLIPEGRGGRVVEWNEKLWIPSETTEDSRADHAVHFHFEPAACETALLLTGYLYADETTPCLEIIARSGRAFSTSRTAFRAFRDLLNSASARQRIVLQQKGEPACIAK